MFATLEDVRLAIGADTLRAIADHARDGTVDDDVVAGALAQASSLVESYLGARAIPDPTPPVIVRATIDIATMYLRQGRDLATDDARAAYVAAIRWLEAVAAGRATLGPDIALAPGDSVPLVSAAPETSGLERLWSRASARRVF